MKKRTALLVACLLLMALFVPSFGVAEEPIVLTFAYWGNAEEIALKEKLAQMYMDANPGVKIEGTYTDGKEYPTKLQTWFAAGTAPDIMGIANDIISPFRDLEVFADLKPYMEKDGLLEGTWNPIAIDVLSNAKGEILAAPFVYKIPAIAYNKTMFDAAGLPYPTDDWTEATMLEYATKLTSGAGRGATYGIFMGGFPYSMSRNLYGNPVYNADSHTMNAEGNAEYRAALELFVDMVGIKKVSLDDNMTDTIGGGFETGIFGMAITAPWDMANYAKMIGDSFEWDIVELPINETFGHWRGPLYSDGWAMAAQSEHPEAAWDFIKFMCTDPEAQKTIAPIGVPMLTSYATSEEYLTDYHANKPYNKQVFVDMLDYATGWETAGVWGKVNAEMKNQHKLLLEGEIDIDTAIANIQKNGTAVLAE